MEIGCPWGYDETEEDHMRMCVPNRNVIGLGDDPTLDPDYVQGGGSGPTYTAPSGWNRNLTVPILGGQSYPTTGGKSVFLSPGNPLMPATDYSWLLYVGLGLGALMLLSKGKR